jgi:hypothetical protein
MIFSFGGGSGPQLRPMERGDLVAVPLRMPGRSRLQKDQGDPRSVLARAYLRPTPPVMIADVVERMTRSE